MNKGGIKVKVSASKVTNPESTKPTPSKARASVVVTKPTVATPQAFATKKEADVS